MGSHLASIFKAYDVRGIYPDQFDEDDARRIGSAFARWIGAEEVVLGKDCRHSSPALAAAFIDGVTGEGVGVADMGLSTTDMVYFASGRRQSPGAMFTASHNPPAYNGLKLCRPGARPVGVETGLAEIQAMAEAGAPAAGASRGGTQEIDMRADYLAHLLRFADLDHMSPFIVAADAANGMAALVVPELFERLPATLIPLFMELDGTFPNHPADPIDPRNQEDVKRAVLAHGADLGLAFDGDADRCFFVDEHANGLSGSLVTALVAIGMLERYPGATIIHNLIVSRMVPEVIREHGGTPVRTRVGHSFIKEVMAESGAVFGGEHSGHYYFRDHYNADSGLVAAMVVMDQMSKSGVPLSELVAPLRRYVASGEINSDVPDPAAAIEAIGAAFADGEQDRLDGLTIDYEDEWFNVRASNTEPLLRLNVEARTEDRLHALTARVLDVIRSAGGRPREE